MDLSLVKKKLMSKKYSSKQEFIDDVKLIWSNCKQYNQEDSPIYKAADKMEKYFQKICKGLQQSSRQKNPMALEDETYLQQIQENTLAHQLTLYKRIATLDQQQ